ncbi:unnamed protein product [Lactuca saligna]|uniref:Uncharacterized protein n=1 Tax=Lactuca saligna TaxID=75948 RepID=A0AA35ZGC3_LACSI|nr:unnamed protein product [Lactuca saligna]
MPGVYDRFNKDLSIGIRAVDAGEKITANEQQQQPLWIQQQENAQEELRIIRTELLEMVKIMKMHRQNQIKREEETEAKIAEMRKYYYSEEGMEAEKAKWRQIYYSNLKEKEKVVNEEEEESLEDTELESDDDEEESLEDTELESDDDEESLEVTELESKPTMEPQLPPSLLPAPLLSPPVLTPPPSSDNEEELSLEVAESESESESTLQLPQPMLPPTEPTLQTSPPPLAPPSPQSRGFEKRNEATSLIMASPNQSVTQLKMPWFTSNNIDGWKFEVERRRPMQDWEEMKGWIHRQHGSSKEGAIYEQLWTLLQLTEDQRRFSEKMAPLVDGRKEVIVGFCINGLQRDKWVVINTLGSQNAEHTMDLMGNAFNLSPNLIVSAMILTTKVKQRLDPRYFDVTLTKLTRQWSPIPQSRTFVSLLPIEPQSATSYSTTKLTALRLEALASPNLAFKILGVNIGSLSSKTSSKHQDPLIREKGTVAFSTGYHGGDFTLTDFAKIYYGIHESKKNIHREYQQWPILTKLGDDLKSDEQTLYVRDVRTIIWWGKKQEIVRYAYVLAVTYEALQAIEPCCWFPIVHGKWCMLVGIKIQEDLNTIENGIPEAYTELVGNQETSELHHKSADDIRNLHDGNNRNIGIRIGVLEEKIVAMQACGVLIPITKSVYVPYLEESLGFMIWSASYFHEDTPRIADTAVKMIVRAARQRDVWVNDPGGTKNMIKRTKDGLKLRETDDGQQQESLRKKFEGFFVSFLGSLMLYLHGWLLWVYLSSLPLHMIKTTSVTHSFLHLEDKVKVWAAGIDKPN